MNCIFAYSQVIKFPDMAFKQAIIANGADQNYNKEIEVFEAESIVRLDISNYGISDLTGIETFKKLQELVCNDNNIKSIDLFQNENLRTLICSRNPLAFLDISKNAKLETLIADETLLTTIDLNQNVNLRKIDLSSTLLTYLDLSQNQQITYLDCRKNSVLIKIAVFNLPHFVNNKKIKKDNSAEWIILKN